MQNRVEICGLNERELPKLSPQEQKELLLRVQNGSEEARQTFIFSNIRLVLSIVRRYAGRASMDDLFQVGCVGLVKAVDHFDAAFSVKFSTYAVPMIIGEIRRFLREGNSMRVSRGIRDMAYRVMQARQQIEASGQRVASLEEIAALLQISVRDVVYAMDAISDPVSLFEPVGSDGEDCFCVMDQICDKHNHDEVWLEHISLEQALCCLSERERMILTKRYYEGKTQTEVSGEIGISQAQVSRLEKSAIAVMKSFYEESIVPCS